MNAATKTRIANILTALASILAIFQTFLTSPPFSTQSVFVMGAVVTYATLLVTTWKQYLSPEISNAGGNVTIVIAIAATLTGLLDLFNVFTLSGHTEQMIKWGITVAVAILNILSKQIFPSQSMKDNMKDLKFEK